MMEFLRALAPSHAAAKTRAVPVVRSRFEDSQPLTRLPAPHAETPTQDTPGDPREILHLSEPAREDDTGRPVPADRDVADRDVVVPADSRVATSPVPGQPLVRSTLQPVHVRAAAVTGGRRDRTEQIHAVPHANAPLAFLRASHPVSAPLQTPAAAIGVTIAQAAGSIPGRGPLSSVAVAERTASRSDVRPVIHVTIDRIDVRAPSAPERTSSRPRSRSNTSGSLGDYLRSRQTSRPGGTP
jgi:hypothetical protein